MNTIEGINIYDTHLYTVKLPSIVLYTSKYIEARIKLS